MRKKDFPIFQKHKRLVYLDTAATAQKPRAVIDAMRRFLAEENAPVHRSIYPLGEQATEQFELVRSKVAKFIGASDPTEVVFTRNATESINIVAQSFGRTFVRAGDSVVVTRMDHHANFVPWIVLAKEMHVELHIVELTPDGEIDLGDLRKNLSRRTKIVAFPHVSNVLGTINPVADIVRMAKRFSPQSFTVVDAAQSAPHMPISVRRFGCDFLVFSGHKLYGPGVGALWGRRELLAHMPPFLTGGQMIREVRDDEVFWNEVPHKFEAGTPDASGVVGLGSAIDYISGIGWQNIIHHERALMAEALRRFEKLERRGIVTVYGPRKASDRCGVLSFAVRDVHPHDVASLLAEHHVAVRASHHCAMPLHRKLGIPATVRISLALYNDRQDLMRFFKALEEKVLPLVAQ